MKWYLEKTGKEWTDDGDASLADLEGADRETGRILYERYLREKKDSEKLSYDARTAEETAVHKKREIELAKDAVLRARKETALAKGLAGTQYADELAEDVGESARRAKKKADERTLKTKEKLLTAYGKKRNEEDEEAEEKLRSVQSAYDKLWRENLNALKSDLSGRDEYRSPFDKTAYSEEGVAEMKKSIEKRKTSLGDRYQSALDWVESLPVYRGDTTGKIVSVGGKDTVVSAKDWQYLDAVAYRKGAGAKVTKLDVFSVTYGGDTYIVKADTQADAATERMLTALATAKKVDVKVGTVLYYGGKLFVSNGAGRWLNVVNTDVVATNKSLKLLLGKIQTAMKE